MQHDRINLVTRVRSMKDDLGIPLQPRVFEYSCRASSGVTGCEVDVRHGMHEVSLFNAFGRFFCGDGIHQREDVEGSTGHYDFGHIFFVI